MGSRKAINKDVSAVNTGNVDAFVRMWLEGEMSVMKKLPIASTTAIPNSIADKLGLHETTENSTMYNLGFKFYDNDKKYYKVLGTTERTNPDLNGTNAATDDNDYSEVKSVQAGSYLVYAPTDAKWYYTAEQQTEIVNKNGENAMVAKDKIIDSKNITAGEGEPYVDALLNVDSNCPIDSDTFTPVTPGLYIFRRNVALEVANTADAYEYSGYVFDGTNYFALCNDKEGNSDYTLPSGAVTITEYTEPQKEPLTYTLDMTKIKLYTAFETIVSNDDLTWTYTEDDTKLTATYNGGTDDTDDDISIDIALDNIGTTGETWTCIAATEKMATFYYNNDVEAGDSTAKLVDSVTLSKDTKQEAFIAFDFDLNVFLESVQITKNEDGLEMTTPVEAGGTFAGTTGNASPAYATAQEIAEIVDIEWNAGSAPASNNSGDNTGG